MPCSPGAAVKSYANSRGWARSTSPGSEPTPNLVFDLGLQSAAAAAHVTRAAVLR